MVTHFLRRIPLAWKWFTDLDFDLYDVPELFNAHHRVLADPHGLLLTAIQEELGHIVYDIFKPDNTHTYHLIKTAHIEGVPAFDILTRRMPSYVSSYIVENDSSVLWQLYKVGKVQLHELFTWIQLVNNVNNPYPHPYPYLSIIKEYTVDVTAILVTLPTMTLTKLTNIATDRVFRTLVQARIRVIELVQSKVVTWEQLSSLRSRTKIRLIILNYQFVIRSITSNDR
jgi:hypothetical protein